MFVDHARFDNIDEPIDDIVSYCGTISINKDGVLDLINAFYLFSIQNPHFKLQLIGDFENVEVKAAVDNIIKRLNLKDKILITGRVSPNRIPSLLSSSRVLVLARPNNKQAAYGFPTKLGEYLATGRPVVVTKVGEIPNFLTDKYDCIFAQPDNYHDFAKQLNWVIDHYDRAIEIGKRGRRLSEDTFSSISQVSHIINFINTLCVK